MDLNAVLKLSPQLAGKVLQRADRLADGAKLTDYDVMRLDRDARVVAADLLAAWEAPQSFQPCPEYKPGAAL